ERAAELVRLQLEARHRLVEAHPQLAETERVERLLEAVDPLEALGRDLGAVGKARRETGELRLVPGRKAERARQLAHLGLGQPRLDQRMARPALVGRAQAGPVIAE